MKKQETEPKKMRGRPITITNEMDRKQKYAASITPNQYAKMVELFPKTPDSSSFEQAITYATTNKEKEYSKKRRK